MIKIRNWSINQQQNLNYIVINISKWYSLGVTEKVKKKLILRENDRIMKKFLTKGTVNSQIQKMVNIKQK